MRYPWLRTIAATALLGTVLAGWRADANASRPPDRREGREAFSPLFARRLEVGIENMDKPAGNVFTARLGIYYEDQVFTPLSGNPASLCLASGCFLSACLGSACLNSRCLGSACVLSGCGASACISSGCGGSSCIGSACGGSACVGSICLGSACVNCPAGSGQRGRARG